MRAVTVVIGTSPALLQCMHVGFGQPLPYERMTLVDTRIQQRDIRGIFPFEVRCTLREITNPVHLFSGIQMR